MMTFFKINVFFGGGYPKKRNNNLHKQGIYNIYIYKYYIYLHECIRTYLLEFVFV